MLKKLLYSSKKFMMIYKNRVSNVLLVAIFVYALLITTTSITSSVFASSPILLVSESSTESFKADVSYSKNTKNLATQKLNTESYISEQLDNYSSPINVTTEISSNDTVIPEVDYDKSGELSEEYVEPIVVYHFENTGYATTDVRIRENPSTDENSKIIDILKFNQKVKYSDYNDEWIIIESDLSENGYAYIYKKYISDTKSEYVSKTIYGDKRKNYMGYKAITSTGSLQYKLQQKAYTGNYGVRMYDDRYLVAVGSGITKTIGQYFDVVLENGVVIPCILGDAKQDRHTNADHTVGLGGNAVEFIVDTPKLSSNALLYGDLSKACDAWDSNVVEMRVYNKFVFN